MKKTISKQQKKSKVRRNRSRKPKIDDGTYVKEIKLPKIGLRPVDPDDPRHKEFFEEIDKAIAEGRSRLL